MISANSDKLVRSLHQKKYRIKNNKFILEGIRTIDCAINNSTSFSFIIYTKRFSNQNPELISKINCKSTEIVSEMEMEKLSPSKSPSGILAIANMIDYGQFNNDSNVVFLDEISDPGNMGTLLRTAEWFGIQNIILSENCVDIFNAKVIRSAMGAHFYLDSISHCNLSNELINLKNNDYSILGADLNGHHISKLKIKKKWVLIVGNEANGLSNKILNQITNLITIPKRGNIESLNAAVAGSILLNTLTN